MWKDHIVMRLCTLDGAVNMKVPMGVSDIPAGSDEEITSAYLHLHQTLHHNPSVDCHLLKVM